MAAKGKAAAGKAAYAVVGFEMINPVFLTPHPAAEMPIDDSDVASIERSIGEHGTLHPLLVSAAEDDRGYRWIYDGVNRWKTATKLGLEAIPCLLVECDNPAMIVAESLAAGRKRSTGQRILVYLEAHREAVLAAREKGRLAQGNIQSQLQKRQQIAGVSRETPGGLDFSAEGIATLLKCCKQDALSALELFEALHTGTVPECVSSQVPAHPADEKELKVLQERRNGVLRGSEPVRTWKKGLFGKTNNGGKGRADADVDCIIKDSLAKLTRYLPLWREFADDRRKLYKQRFELLLKDLPDDLWVVIERQGRA